MLWLALALALVFSLALQVHGDTLHIGGEDHLSNADVQALAQEWHTNVRKRSVPRVTVSHHGEEVSYIVRGAESIGKWGQVVVATPAGDTEGGDVVYLVSHATESTTHVLARHQGKVQKAHMYKGVVRGATARLSTTLPDEAAAVDPSELLMRRAQRCPATKTTNPTTGRTVLRVGVLHTRQARDQEYYGGSSAAIQMEVAAAVAEANQVVLPLSGIGMEIELCANEMVEEDVERTSPGATLNTFAESPKVEAVRVANKCDVMSLFSTLEGLGNRACGVGYVNGQYSVVADVCFVDNYSFLHELGHNLGACHGAPARTCGAGANGYGDPAHHFRTILAYRSICGAVNCTRVPRFSNALPAFTWKGVGIGNTGSDNAWIINANKAKAASNSC